MKFEPPANKLATAQLISNLIQIKGVPCDLLDRHIVSAKWFTENEPEFILTAETMEFETICH